MTRRRLIVAIASAVAAALVAFGVGPPTVFAAVGGPTLELSVILATRSDGGASVDPQLRDRLQLSKEPFVRYNVYKLLERERFPLEVGKAVVHGLVNGRTLHLVLDGVAEDAGEKRYKMETQIAEPGKKAFLRSLQVTASENEPFFVGGQNYQGGTLFLELVVRP
jgi:hypothetical protein